MDEDKRPKPGKGLGRGLSALLGDDGEKRQFQEPRANSATTAPAPPAAPGPSAAELEALRRETFTLPIEFLRPGKFQPRKLFDEEALEQLAQSIREKGLLQPILVRPIGKDSYEILAGERRWRAAQLAKLHDVPVVLRNFADRDALEIALVENLQRRDLSPVEEAQGFARLRDEFGATQQELAEALGKSRSHIANMLRLLDLPEKVLALLNEGKLDAGHARALFNADDAVEMAERVVAQGLSVRQVEKLVQAQRPDIGLPASRNPAARPPVAGTPAQAKSADVKALEKQLEQALGLRVDIAQAQGERTQVSLFCDDYEQLDDVVARLSRTPRG
jgi:ParB family chromosome partitioning protein